MNGTTVYTAIACAAARPGVPATVGTTAHAVILAGADKHDLRVIAAAVSAAGAMLSASRIFVKLKGV